MRSRSLPWKLAAAAAAVGVPSLVCSASDVVTFDSFGPGETYRWGDGVSVDGPQTSSPRIQAYRFVPTASGAVTRLTLPLIWVGGANEFPYQLFSDRTNNFGQSVPAGLLGVVGNLSGVEYDLGPVPLPTPSSVSAAGSIRLTAGTAYWLVGTGIGNATGIWCENPDGLQGIRASRRPDGDWILFQFTSAAFRIEVDPARPGCPADLDGNGQAEPADISMAVSTWFSCLALGLNDGDYDGSGTVEPADISVFVSRWLTAVVAGGC